MKPSIYNYAKKTENGEYILFNKFFGSISIITEETKQALDSNNLAILESEIETDLLSNGFIVDNDLDEISEGRRLFDENRQKDKTLDLIFELTQECNFGCPYCYQNNARTNINLSPEILSRGEIYSRNVLKKQLRAIEQLQVSFIGGEPLIRKPLIQAGISLFRKLADEYSIALRTKIDTNGLLLDEYIVNNFNVISVTLTNKTDHDTYRPLLGGQPTYDRIFNNLVRLKDVFNSSEAELSIRFNANRQNISSINGVILDLLNIGIKNFHVNLQDTINYNFNQHFSNTLSLHEFKQEYMKFLVFLVENDLRIYDYPLPTFAVCKAYIPLNIKISSDGKLGLCDAFTHGRASIDDIYTDPEMYYEVFKEYTSYNPYNDHKCSQCLDIGICGGKYFCKSNENTTDLTLCEFLPYYLDDYLEFFVQSYPQKPHLFRLNNSQF